jgi:hypothetical protein
LAALYRGRVSIARATAHASTWLFIREGGSPVRGLAVFNIAQICLYIRGAIEKTAVENLTKTTTSL